MKKQLIITIVFGVLSTFLTFAQEPLYGLTCEEAPYIANGYDEYLTAGTYWFRSSSYDFPFTITYTWDKAKHPKILMGDERPECVVDFSCVTMEYDDPTLYKVMQYAIDSLNKEWPVIGHLNYDPVNENFFREFSKDYRTALYVFGITDNTPIYLKITLFVDGYLQFNSNSPHAQCIGRGTSFEMNNSFRLDENSETELYLWPIAEWAHTNYQLVWAPDNGTDELYMAMGEWCNVDKDNGSSLNDETFFMEEYDGVYLWNSNKALYETKEWGMSEEYVRFYPEGSGTFRVEKLPANIQQFAMLDSTVFATIDRNARTVTAILPKGTDRNTAVENAIIIFEPVNQNYSFNNDFTQITIDDGLNTTYALNISVVPYTANDDATLKEITVDGKPIAGFNPSTLEYTVNCDAVPVIGATANDPNRYGVEIKQGSDYVRYATITVAAEDIYTTLTYTVNFILPKHTDATLKTIKANDRTIDGFNANVFSYNYNVASADKIPAIVGTPNDRLASCENVYEASKTVLPDSTVLVCTAEDGSSLRYVIHFNNYVSNDITAELYINGVDIGPLNASKKQYNGIVVPSWPPVVDVVTTHPNATVEFLEPSLRNEGKAATWQFTVTAEDGKTSQKYTTNYVVSSVNAYLHSILLDGNELAGFDSAVFVYELNVAKLPVEVTPVKSADDATVETSSTTLENGTVVYTFVVTASDSKTKCSYSLTLHEVAQSKDASLANITLDGKTLEGFKSSQTQYEVTVYELPADVKAVTNDPDATVETEVNNVNNIYFYHFIVTAPDGVTQQTYNLTIQLVELSSDATLSLISLDNGESAIDGFSPDKTSYSFEFEQLPDHNSLYVEANHNKATFELTWTSIENGEQATILVTAEDGVTTKTYTVTFNLKVIELDHDATLAQLLVGDMTVTQFAAGQTTTVNVESLDKNTVVGVPTKSVATVQYQWSENTLNLTVTAEDGETKLTYTFQFVLPVIPQKNNDATLNYITIFDQQYTDFSPNVEKVIFLNNTAIPTENDVTIVPTDSKATYSVDADVDAGFFIITITAEDGKTRLTYIVIVEIVILSDDNTLADITLDGIPMADFDAHRTDYELSLYSLPTVGATANSDVATLTITQPTENYPVATILVTAENGDQRTYSVTFNIIHEQAATLIPLEVMFANGFKGFIDAEQSTVDVYYLASESAPASIKSWKAQEGESLQSVELTTENELLVKSEDAEARYTVNYHPVQPGALQIGTQYSFDGAETYIKTPYFYTDSRGWRIAQDNEETDNRRISRGKDRIYLFLPGCAALRLQTTTVSQSVRISLNGENITEKQTRFDRTTGHYYTASQGGYTYINALTNGEPVMLEIETENADGDVAFNAVRLLDREDPGDAVEINYFQDIVYSDGVICNPNGMSLQVYSVTGQLVATGSDNIDLSSQPRALYIIRCNEQTLKIIKF